MDSSPIRYAPLFFFSPFLLLLFFLFISSPSTCDGHAAMVPCQASERDALLEFKHGIAYKRRLSAWIAGGDCCSWPGIVCDNRTGHVVELSLPYSWETSYAYHLRGRISPSLASLKHLQHLDLSGNDFQRSSIPPFLGSFKNLRYLNLSGGNFAGVILPQLGNLKYLQRLDLSMNDFGGSPIPPFLGSFEHLRYLSLSSSNFSGVIPPQLGNLSSLEALDLSSHSYPFGDLESAGEWLANLSSLRQLDLSTVNLSKATGLFEALNKLPFLSTIRLSGSSLQPASLSVSNASFSRLLVLVLSYNHMDFRLPRWFLNATSLEHLDLSSNEEMHDANEIAQNLCNLRYLSSRNTLVHADLGHFFMGCGRRLNLESLYLSRSRYITGQLPEWLVNCKHLRWLDLSSNLLSGSIPATIDGMASIEYLILSNNNMSGHVSPSLWKLRSLQHLDLSGNAMHGNFIEEDFGNLSELKFLDLSFNSLQFTLPPSWTPPFSLETLRMGSCKLGPRFPLWLQTQNHLEELNMSNTGISDVLPQWTWNFSSSALFMDLSMNKLKGIIPSTLCNNTRLGILDLSNNLLSGQLPHCLGNSLRGIASLHLSNNNLQGILPASLQYCTDMQVLDVSYNRFTGEIPSWMAEKMSALVVLSLRSNLFHGSIPPQLSDLTSLQVLDLANNNFSGSLPPTFGNFVAMQVAGPTRDDQPTFFYQTFYTGSTRVTYYRDSMHVTMKGTERVYSSTLKLLTSIDLSANRLSGEIPESIGNLTGLITMNLSHNWFYGRIPEDFGTLSKLESLDLSRNNLSGGIPESLKRLTFLGEFNVSFNNLSGSIPSGGQFDTFPNSSYMGNHLCGKPLEACENNHPSNPEVTNDENTNNDSIWLYVSIVLGFIVGFWTFLGTLVLKGNWRYAYIRFVDEQCERCYVCIFQHVRTKK